jgi:CRISPR-associated Csx11 family protein
MTEFEPAEKLKEHRPLLLALEAIGWLHMTGKAKADFLRKQGGQEKDYDELRWYEKEAPPFPWDDLLGWVKEKHKLKNSSWPGTITNFLTKHRGMGGKGFLGLLQAAHAMASGIEKNLAKPSSHYLVQDAAHMWLSTAFGHPVRNLLASPSAFLSPQGWHQLLDEIQRILKELRDLGRNGVNNPIHWQHWREKAIGPDSYLRQIFSSTLAETRVPNNDVTLWDQSYVAAALFKSAAAGAILEGNAFAWDNLKQNTRWRLLTIGIGADYYESRAVKIGDWTGARMAIENFFSMVGSLIEVDLAIGSLLYKDGSVCVFSFPGYSSSQQQEGDDPQITAWKEWLTEQIDQYAQEVHLDTPPYCNISEPSRSLVAMTKGIRRARETTAVPLHRPWTIKTGDGKTGDGHVCPVCLMRKNNSRTDKQKPCEECDKRREQRLKRWQKGNLGRDSIWVGEVADTNGRVALITMNLDIEPWLEGRRLDALRSQAIAEWRRFNPVLSEYWQRDKNKRKEEFNPIIKDKPFYSLLEYIERELMTQLKTQQLKKENLVFNNLQEGFKEEEKWDSFFSKIVEDRVEAERPIWEDLSVKERAHWLAHQFFRKLASPGRIYRFQRQAKEFFDKLMAEFRELAASNPNHWRTRRLIMQPGNGFPQSWQDKQTYICRFKGAPISLLYRRETGDFITISNLARVLERTQGKDLFSGETIELKDENNGELVVEEVTDSAGALGVYYPVIPLEVSPTRFRVLLPLEAVSACVDRAIAIWQEEFARVWSHLPLQIGVVAFPEMTPFQAVVEMARNLEKELDNEEKWETWRVAKRLVQQGNTVLSLIRPGGRRELWSVPVILADGREDVFYPYFAVEDEKVRYPLDFQAPGGQVYRHAKDLRCGDGICVYPPRIATVFLDSAGKRFEPVRHKWNLSDWQQMRQIWNLIEDVAPSRNALRAAWSELVKSREAWRGPDGNRAGDGGESWLEFARTVLHDRLGVKGACLDALAEGAREGILEWSLEWHLTVLKKRVGGDE